jgi:branched-subunit amino acid transport protein
MNDPNGLLLLLVCVAASVSLRVFGVMGAGRLHESSALFRWIGCVAFAIATGIMAKIIVTPSGALAEVSLFTRLAGVAIGLAVFFLTGRRIFVSLIAGVSAFVVLSLSVG